MSMASLLLGAIGNQQRRNRRKGFAARGSQPGT
jgi:hypothetical protein